MTNPPGPPAASPVSAPPTTPTVAVVVLSGPDRHPQAALAAVGRQVYVPARVLVVGTGGTGEHGPYQLVETLAELPDGLEGGFDFVWFIHHDTRPRPDALRALVEEAVRHDASVAGSKVLVEGTEDRLHSVGEATDVFGEPYSGLDPGELDLEQYDVVREVAFVSPVSLLVRGDLLKGLRGLDRTLPLEAAGLDLSQRSRLAGGKVIVVPSSEVFHPDGCPHDGPVWRRRAGRQKAMLTAYRLVTLAWVVPVGLLVGLAEGIGQMLLGRLRPLVSMLGGWLWNAGRLWSTFSARRSLRRIRQVGDEELFRFQVGGSVRLRRTLAELGDRFAVVLKEDEQAERTPGRARQIWRGPRAVLTAVSVLGVAVATRQVWLSGMPAAGYALPPDSGTSGLAAAYGGGWHGAGLGSPEAAPPIVALGAMANLAIGDHPGTAAALLTIGSLVAGLWGMARVARRIGASGPGAYAAGWVYVAGAASATLFGSGQWPLLVAAGPLPWALEAIAAPSGGGWRSRLGRFARAGVAAGLSGAAFPPLLAAFPVFGLLWAVLSGRLAALLTGAVATVLGTGLIAPFVVGGDLEPLLIAGPLPSIEPEWLWPGSVVIAAVVALAASHRTRVAGAALAGLLATGGWLVARLPGLYPGVGLGAMLLASAGGGMLAGLLVETSGPASWRRLASLAAAGLLLAPAFAGVVGGRAGLPADQWSSRLGFVSTLTDSGAAARILLVGAAGDLPGSSRRLGAVSYRLIDGDAATLDQAYLPTPREGDAALEAVVEAHLLRGIDLRPGAALAPFGVGWVVVLPGADLGPTPFQRQVDLIARPVDPELAVYENLAFAGRVTPMDEGDGDGAGAVEPAWVWDGAGYQGAGFPGRLRLADNADPRWGPDWVSTDGWANSISGSLGRSTYEPTRTVTTAGVAAGAWTLLLLVCSWWGTARPGGEAVSPDLVSSAESEVRRS